MTTETKTRRQTCTDHCAGCNQHFHGLGAFERHRQNGSCALGGSAVASKGKNVGQPLLQAWTEQGWCALQSGSTRDGVIVNWHHPVPIWQVYGSSYSGPTND